MGRTPGSTRSVIEVRQRRVQRLMADGLGVDEIAEELDVSRATIKRDVQRIQEHNLRNLRGMDGEVLGAELHQRYLRRRSALAALAREHRNNPHLQIRVAQEEADQDEKFLAMMQSLGMVYQQPIEVAWELRAARVAFALSAEHIEALKSLSREDLREWMRQHNLLPQVGMQDAGPMGLLSANGQIE